MSSVHGAAAEGRRAGRRSFPFNLKLPGRCSPGTGAQGKISLSHGEKERIELSFLLGGVEKGM